MGGVSLVTAGQLPHGRCGWPAAANCPQTRRSCGHERERESARACVCMDRNIYCVLIYADLLVVCFHARVSIPTHYSPVPSPSPGMDSNAFSFSCACTTGGWYLNPYHMPCRQRCRQIRQSAGARWCPEEITILQHSLQLRTPRRSATLQLRTSRRSATLQLRTSRRSATLQLRTSRRSAHRTLLNCGLFYHHLRVKELRGLGHTQTHRF